MIRGIHHIALVVQDFDAVLPYYTDAAGLRRLPDDAVRALGQGYAEATNPDDPPIDQHLLAGPNGYLKILSPRQKSLSPSSEVDPINRPGIRHFCVQNRDCSILEKAVLRNRGSLIAPPLDLGTGNQYAYARDPEGNIMEIEGLPYAPAEESSWMGHVAIVTRDLDAAIAFYSQLLGSTLQNRGRFGPGPQFDRMGALADTQIEGAWLPAGNMLLELWQFHAPEYPVKKAQRGFLDAGYSHICLETDHLEEDATRLVELSGELMTGIMENGAVRSTFARDPEGNIIELLEMRTSNRQLSIAALPKPDICARIEAGR